MIDTSFFQQPEKEKYMNFKTLKSINLLKKQGTVFNGAYRCDSCPKHHAGLDCTTIYSDCYIERRLPIPPLDGSWG